ncbi:MAG TPA: hypothetical protein VGF06_04110 [Terriglobales bacterium]|jgi:hypothetical protein
MRVDLLAFYGGPDQIMTVTSGLASVLGVLLIFWNKIVGLFFRVVRIFRGSPAPGTAQSAKDSSTPTP